MSLTLRYAARSDVGLVREGNEDSGYAGPGLLVVADGMGGHAAGEVASAAAVEVLSHLGQPQPGADARGALSAAISDANDRIRDLIDADSTREGMGTTLTVLLWTGEHLVVAHIGDSRAYQWRRGTLHQITQDHTFVQALVDEGKITEDEARAHPARSLVLRALDGRGEPDPDIFSVEVEAGDRVLVCSDGLSGVVTDTTIEDVLSEGESLDATSDRLVELALRGGAPDNVTVVLAEFVEGARGSPPAAVLVGAAHEPPERRRHFWQLRGDAGEAPERQADPEQERYAPRPPKRLRWLRRLVYVTVLAAIVVVGGREFLAWAKSQYYIGAHSGSVAIFQGLSQGIGPVTISKLHEEAAGLPVEALPPYYQEQVEASISAADPTEAEQIVERLRRQACLAHPTPSVTPSPTPPAPATTPGTVGTAASPQAVPTSPAPQPVAGGQPTPTPGGATAAAGDSALAEGRFPGLECPEELSR